MRKQDLTRNSVVGQVTTLPDQKRAERLFRLLEAVPFTITRGQSLQFEYPEAAGHLLRNHVSELPDSNVAWMDRLSFQSRRDRQAALKRLTWDGAQYRLKYQLKLDTGESVWIEETGERIAGQDATPTEIIGTLRYIDRVQSELEKAAYLDRYDARSGLMNERSFRDAVNHVCALTKRQKSSAALIRLRATNLGDINAIYGYDTGDRLIRLIGERLANLLRAPDHVARLEGPDFGLCIIGADENGAHALMSRLKEPLLDTPYATPHGGLYIEFTASATILGEAAFTATDALRQTAGLYEGDDNHLTWAPKFYENTQEIQQLNQSSRAARDISQDIIAALNERRISIAYQPIIDARTRDLHHYECLLRLRREDGEIISAGNIIMAAEKLGLINLLDRRALELAAETLHTMPDIHLALNVSAATIKDEAAVEDYLTALKSLGPMAQRLTLELTETAALDDPGLASFFSVETRKLGCDFAIDDFGSGYTTFRNLMAIEADSIKIDGSYIQGIATEPHKETFVRMMVDLAQTFSVKTVAEMVDNRADAELLRRLGVDYLQGYMFGYPSAAPAWRRQSA
ncbi:EAL domain-containing protein [Litorimonas sp. RW-G-Af-16]|uniref:EAL domain-containing protein n=1 Tax=Litorimonas sp. RW-G-Af-16 TaxID=3241168 RepID=UPI003AB10109